MLATYTRYSDISLITLDSENTQLVIHTNLIFPLFFYQTPQKIAMLISMTNLVMNVTYYHSNISTILPHRNIISIHASKNRSKISPFGIDGNIEERHLVPRIPTKECSFFFSNPLHQSFSCIDIPQCASSKHVVLFLSWLFFSHEVLPHDLLMMFFMPYFSHIDINVKGLSNHQTLQQMILTSSSVQRKYSKQDPTRVLDDAFHHRYSVI